jgi:hypothetical protein
VPKLKRSMLGQGSALVRTAAQTAADLALGHDVRRARVAKMRLRISDRVGPWWCEVAATANAHLERLAAVAHHGGASAR